jgi:hypothetical protein
VSGALFDGRGLSDKTKARVQSIEVKLAELDPTLNRFCAENGFSLSAHVGVWPRRKPRHLRQVEPRCTILPMFSARILTSLAGAVPVV